MLALAAWVAVLADRDVPPHLDMQVAQWWPHHRVGWLDPVMSFVSTAFSPGPAIVLAVLVAALLAWRAHSAVPAIVVLAPTAVTMLGVVALKLAVVRPRPPLELQLGTETDPSFPSGHAAGILALGVAVVFVLWPRLRGAASRTLAVLAVVALTTLVAVSRLYLDAHWLTDVVAGLLIAAACAAVLPGWAAALCERLPQRAISW